jgi:hypothetical protein
MSTVLDPGRHVRLEMQAVGREDERNKNGWKGRRPTRGRGSAARGYLDTVESRASFRLPILKVRSRKRDLSGKGFMEEERDAHDDGW